MSDTFSKAPIIFWYPFLGTGGWLWCSGTKWVDDRDPEKLGSFAQKFVTWSCFGSQKNTAKKGAGVSFSKKIEWLRMGRFLLQLWFFFGYCGVWGVSFEGCGHPHLPVRRSMKLDFVKKKKTKSYTPLKLTASSPLKIGHLKLKRESIPTGHCQRRLPVSFGECIVQKLTFLAFWIDQKFFSRAKTRKQCTKKNHNEMSKIL